jgi:hypothetical protein
MMMTMIELQADNHIALPFGGLITKILKKKLTFIPPNEPVEMLEGCFGKATVLKSNAQLNRFQMPDDLASSAPSASSSTIGPFNAKVLCLLTQMNDWLISMDDRFLTMDQRMQLIETDVVQMKLNVLTTLRNILPEDQQDQAL